ncbi:S-adenosyl-L-methionine-dependent methyltransferase [Hypoxylon sp. FL1284]|nr:S-adenosyl-L-methionine-dependent methyltransferase [Hypoxylon sp. FL1284]
MTPTTPVIGKPKPNSSPDAAPTSKIVALAQKISAETQKVDAYFREKGLEPLSFDVDAPSDFPKVPDDISTSRHEVIEATRELQSLMVGPKESVRWMAWDFMSTQSLQLLNHYGIPNLVPLEGTITLSQLEAKTTLDGTNLARLLRHAMTNRLFQEPEPGVIAHTAASRQLVGTEEENELRSWVGFNGEEVFASSARVADALRADPDGTSMEHTGFNYAFGTAGAEPMFVTLSREPPRAARMARAMASLTGGEGYELAHLIDTCDLSAADARGGTLVDVGGSHGFACAALGARWRNLRFVVQDLAATVAGAPDPVCADAQVARRVRLQAHDFFGEQPVRGADVYLLRWIMHNYSRPYAVRILRNLVPALKPGARVLINDHCFRSPGAESPWDERLMRSMDLVMMTLLNAQERDEREFVELFEEASDGFVFRGVTRTKGCRMSIIEAVWKPDEVDKALPAENTTRVDSTPSKEQPPHSD